MTEDLSTLKFSRQQGDNMPLAFQSTNHGSIAFGFFNIESDMLPLSMRKHR
jgi:hypothetical protein